MAKKKEINLIDKCSIFITRAIIVYYIFYNHIHIRPDGDSIGIGIDLIGLCILATILFSRYINGRW